MRLSMHILVHFGSGRSIFYLYATEMGVLYKVSVHVPRALLNMLREDIIDFLKPKLNWFYSMESITFPSCFTQSDKERVQSKIYLWKKLDDHVRINMSLQPIHSFRYGTQVFLSKIKGGEDGATQIRAILRGPCTQLSWTGKVVT